MISHTVCPLCESGLIEPYLKCNDNLVTKEEFDLYRCNSCGFIFTNGYPDEQRIGRYYDSDKYISHEDNARGLVNRIYVQARRIMLLVKKNIIFNTTGLRKGRLLDIGSGTGYFAGEMKQSGWSVTGIEPDSKARGFSVRKFGLNVIDPSGLAGLPDGAYDCITLWHVLEHFHDLSGYAGEIRRLLKPGGHCIVALPNSSSFDATAYREHWAAWDVPRHLWHFNPSTFRLFAGREGFQIMRVRPLPLDVFYISILSSRDKGSIMPFIAGITAGAWFWIKSLFWKPGSSSLIYILTHE